MSGVLSSCHLLLNKASERQEEKCLVVSDLRWSFLNISFTMSTKDSLKKL